MLNQQITLRVNRIRELGSEHRASLLSLMQQARWARCKDPRDRIYGALNMCNTTLFPGFQITPDYTLSTEDVYKNLVLLYVKHANSLNILIYTGIDKTGSSVQGHLPSWVPDWTAESCHGIIISQPWVCAGGRLPAYTELIGQRTLRAEGVVISKIAEFGPEPDLRVGLLGGASLSPSNLFKMTYQMFPLSSKTLEAYGSHTALLETYCRTILLGDVKELYLDLPSSGLLYFNEAMEIMNDMFESCGKLEEDRLLSQLQQTFFRYCHLVMGKIAITEDGHIGLVPKAANIGDTLCVLPGYSGVMVLRSTPDIDGSISDHRDTYQIVGDAFFDGYMMGEALLGELPNGHKVRFTHWLGDSHGELVFSDASGNNLKRDDPRFGLSLKESLSFEEAMIYRSRMTPEVLRSRGIQIRSLDLV
ncbi:hypothetical protein ACHAPU_010868 [Fusarium lateritium]